MVDDLAATPGEEVATATEEAEEAAASFAIDHGGARGTTEGL